MGAFRPLTDVFTTLTLLSLLANFATATRFRQEKGKIKKSILKFFSFSSSFAEEMPFFSLLLYLFLRCRSTYCCTSSWGMGTKRTKCLHVYIKVSELKKLLPGGLRKEVENERTETHRSKLKKYDQNFAPVMNIITSSTWSLLFDFFGATGFFLLYVRRWKTILSAFFT